MGGQEGFGLPLDLTVNNAIHTSHILGTHNAITV